MSDATESQDTEDQGLDTSFVTSAVVQLTGQFFQMARRNPVYVQVIVALADGDCQQTTYIHPELSGQDREAVANMVMHFCGEAASRLRDHDDQEDEAA